MENISYGRPYANTFEIEQAARAADALSFINNLGSENAMSPNESINKDDISSDTRYSRLNPGFRTKFDNQLTPEQEQRISIARAVINKPQIFLLDSVSRNLDVKSQNSINETLHNVTQEQTTIICSDSFKDMGGCHRIAILGNGSVVKEMSYRHLLELTQP